MQAAQHKNLRLRERLSLSVIRSAMLSAQNLADQAAQYGDVPVGAVVLSPQGQVIGKGYNQVYHHHDVGAHAEMIALRQACQALKSSRLSECHLVVTLEPCAMCAQAIAWAHIATLIYGAYDPKSGGVDHGACIFDLATCHHTPFVIGGFMEKCNRQKIQQFFKSKR